MDTTQQRNNAPIESAPDETATLYRMVMEKHTCPYGIKSKDLLERKGFAVDDHHLTSREETDAFRDQQGVSTTPQTWIGFYPVLPDTSEKLGFFGSGCHQAQC